VGVALFNPSKLAAHAFAFGEDQGRYLLAVSPQTGERVYALARAAGVSAEPVGIVGGDVVSLDGDGLALGDLRAAYEGWLPAYMSKVG
jgi:phosphoribosylformylglycinamidine synthase